MTPETQSPVTLVNLFTARPGRQPELVALLRENIEGVIHQLPGWIATELIAGADGNGVAIRSQWRGLEDIAAMRRDARMQAYFPRVAALAEMVSTAGDVVASYRA